MARHFHDVWFLTPEKAQTSFKWVWFSDSGSLELTSAGGACFQSRKSLIEIPKIQTASLTRSTMPWGTFAIVAAVVAAIFALSPGTAIPVGLIAALAAVDLCKAFLFSKWVLVGYTDSDGEQRFAYFADGSCIGWRGVFGGTRRLLKAIQTTEPHDYQVARESEVRKDTMLQRQVHPSIYFAVLFGGLGTIVVFWQTPQFILLREAASATYALVCFGGAVVGAIIGVVIWALMDEFGAGSRNLHESRPRSNHDTRSSTTVPIRFDCSVCGKKLRSGGGTEGKIVKCPTCQNRLRVPQANRKEKSKPAAVAAT